MIIVEIAGHLGTDPETRFTASGQKVITLRVAANSRKKDETVWWKVTIWGDRFDKLLQYLKKGSAVIVIGELSGKPEIYTDREGRQQVSMEITADIVKFSPFGKPEQRQGQSQEQQHASHGTMTGHAPSGQFPGAVHEAPFGHVTAGQGAHHAESDDMPF